MQAGDTFFLSSRGDRKLHLYVIISRTNTKGNVLCVSFSSTYPGFADKACVIQPGQYDFKFIKRSTFVDYGQAKEVDTTMIRINIQGGRWTQGESIPEALLRKIQDGARKSAFLAQKFRAYFFFF
jgi:hypothetical protein